MPEHRRITEGEAIILDAVEVDCRAMLRSVYFQGGFWKVQVEFAFAAGGGYQRVAIPLNLAKLVLPDKPTPPP